MIDNTRSLFLITSSRNHLVKMNAEVIDVIADFSPVVMENFIRVLLERRFHARYYLID